MNRLAVELTLLKPKYKLAIALVALFIMLDGHWGASACEAG